ncbi:Transposable element Tcb1 transposase, partial [Stegodyphus mimosarum]
MQDGSTDRRVQLHPPQCTTSRDDRNILRMAVTDRSVISRTIAQHIQSVTHHPVSARTIRRCLQQSGLSTRRPLLRLPSTQNHRRLRRQWCHEIRMWTAEWNEIVFTDESCFCLQHHDGRIRVWSGERMLNSCVMQRHTGPAPGIMVWSDIGYYSRTPLMRIASTLNSQRYISEVLEPIVLPYLQGLPTAIFQQDNARPHVAPIVQGFFVNRQIELLPWPARSSDLSPIDNMWSMVAERLAQITSQAATPGQLWQRVEAAWSAVPQEHIQSLFEPMPRRVVAVISNNGGADYYYDIVTGKLKRLYKHLVAAETLFDWSLLGYTKGTTCTSTAFNIVVEEDIISDQIKNFGDLKSLGIKPENESSDPLEDVIMEKFESEILYKNSRYKARLMDV